jgi:hypothetical protein
MKALLTGTEPDFICMDKSGVFEKVIVAVASQNLTIDYIKFIVEQYEKFSLKLEIKGFVLSAVTLYM